MVKKLKKVKQIRFRKGSKQLTIGQQIGKLTVIQRVRDNVKASSPNLKVQYLVECTCGTRLTIPKYYLVRDNPKQNCGECTEKSIKMKYNQEYRCWLMMHYRTENPKHESYEHYRARGISVDQVFHKTRGTAGFEAWLAEMGPRPSREYSCDRINNTRGYEPGNIRWATAAQQRANQGNRIDGVLIVDDEVESTKLDILVDLVDGDTDIDSLGIVDENVDYEDVDDETSEDGEDDDDDDDENTAG